MAGGSWVGDKARAGVYINFEESAIEALGVSIGGTVAMALHQKGTGTEKTVYKFNSPLEAKSELGADVTQAISLAFQGGAGEVIAYILPATPLAQDYTDMRSTLETQIFSAFCFDKNVSTTEEDATKTWCLDNKAAGNHFLYVAGGAASDDISSSLTVGRCNRLKDEYVVNVANGIVYGSTNLTSGQTAPYIAGLILGTPLRESITYKTVTAAADVTKRWRATEIDTLLAAGALVLVNDGVRVKVERGVTTADATGVRKIKIVRARQVIATSLATDLSNYVIGKVPNNKDGQVYIISLVKAFLQVLANMDVIDADFDCDLDPVYPSIEDRIYLLLRIKEVDAVEEIYFTISV